MSNIKSFAVIGGDLRQVHLAGLLAADGYNVFAAGFDRDVSVSPDVIRLKSPTEAVKKSNCVILPLPFSVDGLTVNAPFARIPFPLPDIWDPVSPDTLVTGGKFDKSAKEAAGKRGYRLVDYYDREELAVLNTIPTAEGAIQIAMEELPITINRSKCLVTGFGRVAKTLSHDLKALGAEVSVCARKFSDLAWIKSLGYTPLHMLSLTGSIEDYDVIFNTVPSVVLSEAVLAKVRSGSLVIDLASKPGGVDFETAGKLGVRTIWALSLPGKVAPLTAGSIIKETILNIAAEEDL